jgi:hypothetical protein
MRPRTAQQRLVVQCHACDMCELTTGCRVRKDNTGSQKTQAGLLPPGVGNAFLAGLPERLSDRGQTAPS